MTRPELLPPSEHLSDTTPTPRRRWLGLIAGALGASSLGLVAVNDAGAAPSARPARMVSVDRDVIHLRAGPGTRHEARFKLSRGFPLRVIGRRGGWLQVKDFEGDTGWVLARLTGRRPHMVVKVPVANLRRGPGTGHGIVDRLHLGEVLRTVEHRGAWVRVRRDDGTRGWVARRLVWGW